MQHPVVNTEEGSNPGAPLAWGSPENPDDAVAGYGYVPCDTSEVEETFYYHSDHLGSTAYITDQKANVTQYDAYLPYGELLVDEHSSSADLPYKFNGKELDEETGLYYYGARYMNPLTSMWYGVDPLTEKYVNIGAYIYCHGNPIRLIDPDGCGDKDKAKTVINDFANNQTSTVFPNISKETFINDLNKQINDPSTIRQGKNGTCGAAALCKYMAEKDPELYAQTAIGLYTKGTYSKNNINLSITEDMKSGKVRDLDFGAWGKISTVDAIMQGAITNWANYVSEMNPFKGESGLNTFLWPGRAIQFAQEFIGAKCMVDNWPTNADISSIDYKKYYVMGVVNAVEDSYNFQPGVASNHYVNITGFSKDNKVQYWSWGKSGLESDASSRKGNGVHELLIFGR